MSTLKADTIQSTGGGAVTLTNQSAAKLFVNFNGTGTVAIRGSLNVTSITDLSTGDYRVNYGTNFANINYALSHSQKNGTTGRTFLNAGGTNQTDPTTSNSEIMSYNEASTAYIDPNFVYATAHGDLA
jgi:hypothetical protein